MVRTRLVEGAPGGWDAFVRDHPGGTPFHLSAWSSAVEHGLRCRSRLVVAERDGQIAGGLPLHLVTSVLFGNRLVSSPQAAYGGPLAHDEATVRALVEHAEQEAVRLDVEYLELRFPVDPGDVARGERWREDDLYVTMGGPIVPSPQDLLLSIRRKVRAHCRRGDRVLVAEESAGHFDAFRRVFAVNQRNLGTPVLPTRFLRAVADAEDLGSRVMLVRHEGEPVAGCLSLAFRDRVMPYYGGTTPGGRRVDASHTLFFNVIRKARDDGLAYFDFGRSKRGSGSYDFKRRWGFPARDLAYRYRLVRAEEKPSLNPSNPRYRRKIEAWKRLPLWAANALGPLVSPGL